MSILSTIVVAAVVLGTVGIVLLALKARLGTDNETQRGSAARFNAKPFLTENELEFLGRLDAAAPELRFHSQVSMGALIVPVVSRKDGKEYFRARGMFSQKIIDFVAQRRADGSIVAVIELDDRTHDSDKEGKRDAMLMSAGYRVVRWNSKAKPDLAAIRAELVPQTEESSLPKPASGLHGRRLNR